MRDAERVAVKLYGPFFLIMYEEPGIPVEYFGGEQAEQCARKRFEQVLDSYNASLFQRIDDGIRSPGRKQ